MKNNRSILLGAALFILGAALVIINSIKYDESYRRIIKRRAIQ